MKLFNTLTRQLDEVIPINEGVVSVYTCGPTVYDYAHIGHWFNYVRMDTLVRTLKASGLELNWVMNITDVGHLVSDADEGEDKLEKGARREGKTAWEVAEFYTKDFLECMRLLGVTEPNHIVKATEHIPEQIELIQKLEEKGFTYVIDDGVYYDTSKFEGYAAFARLDLEEQEAGARVAYNEQKRNSSDFALWKFSPKDNQRDMEWESPWGKGFPGWHIECSAMAMKYLGDTLDIHTGGIDHVPVHHTNEIAQSEAATGKRFANYWMHSNHLMVEGEKISKSLNNGVRLQEILEKGFSTEAVRLLVLKSHYMTRSQFSLDTLDEAKTNLKDLHSAAVLRWQTVEKPKRDDNLFDGTYNTIKQYFDANLNTPEALTYLYAFCDTLAEDLVSNTDRSKFESVLTKIDDLTGLQLMAVKDISDEQKQLLRAREQAREAKDWSKADTLRDELQAQGVGVRDTQYGSIWFPL